MAAFAMTVVDYLHGDGNGGDGLMLCVGGNALLNNSWRWHKRRRRTIETPATLVWLSCPSSWRRHSGRRRDCVVAWSRC